MSLDRFVYFHDRKPTADQVRCVIEDFFGTAATVELTSPGSNPDSTITHWWVVRLPGTPTNPFLKVLWAESVARGQALLADLNAGRQERAFEVVYDSASALYDYSQCKTDADYDTAKPIGIGVSVDVLTRQADAYTNSLAAGLAEELRRFWSGTMGAE